MLSVVIYLNEDWDEDWGDNLIYDTKRDKTQLRSVSAGNCVIWNYNNFAF